MGPVPGFHAIPQDREPATRSPRRVLAALTRFVDAGLFPERDPRALGVQLWAQVHGLATLEMQGKLGSGSQAEQRWRDATAAHVGPTTSRQCTGQPADGHGRRPDRGEVVTRTSRSRPSR